VTRGGSRASSRPLSASTRVWAVVAVLVDFLLDLVASLLDGFAALLPESDLPYSTEVEGWARTMNGYLRAMIGDVFPIDSYLAVIRSIALVWFSAFATLVFVRWFYRHIPIVGNG